MQADISQQKNDIIKGSKSFSAASFFFSKKQKEAAWKLYSWCRYCDDQIDDHPLPVAKKNLETLRSYLQGLGSPTPTLAPIYQLQGLKEVVQEFQIPVIYLHQLLDGMEMDVQGRRYKSVKELEEYCYGVAGVVGLMMCHIMGIKSEEALKHAVALGNAMQLTNISRDIQDDYKKGRIYLPEDLLENYGIPRDDLMNPRYRDDLIKAQESILKRADELYQSGYAGLSYLSPRCAWAVLIAGKIYSEIGHLIRQKPSQSLERRVFVSKPRKVALAFSATMKLSLYFVRSAFLENRTYTPIQIWREK